MTLHPLPPLDCTHCNALKAAYGLLKAALGGRTDTNIDAAQT